MFCRFHLNRFTFPVAIVLVFLLLQVSLFTVASTESIPGSVPGSSSVSIASTSANDTIGIGDDDYAAMNEIARKLVPQCAKSGERAGSFVLLFMGHSGSTALISALQQHSDVHVTGFEPVDHGELSRDTLAALRYLDSFFTTGKARNQISGFKIRPYHVLKEPRKWSALFRKHKTRVIWNYRSNIFKQAVGHWPILYLNDKTAYEGLSVDGKGRKRHVDKFEIGDSKKFHKLLSSRWRGEQEVEKAITVLGSDTCILPVSYELLLEEPNKAFAAMQHFLGIPVNRSIQAQRLKATSDNLCDIVTNWNKLCRDFFLCTRWRPMMDDTVNGCTCPIAPGVHTSSWRHFCEPESQNIKKPPPPAQKHSPVSITTMSQVIQSNGSKLVIEWNHAIVIMLTTSLIFAGIVFRVVRSSRRRSKQSSADSV